MDNHWKKPTSRQFLRKKDVLLDRFGNTSALERARHLLEAEDQSEEAFLGAQGVLLLQGLL